MSCESLPKSLMGLINDASRHIKIEAYFHSTPIIEIRAKFSAWVRNDTQSKQMNWVDMRFASFTTTSTHSFRIRVFPTKATTVTISVAMAIDICLGTIFLALWPQLLDKFSSVHTHYRQEDSYWGVWGYESAVHVQISHCWSKIACYQIWRQG